MSAGLVGRCGSAVALLAIAASAVGISRAGAATVADAGTRAQASGAQWDRTLADDHGRVVLRQRSDGAAAAVAGLIGFRRGGWQHATRVLSSRRNGAGYAAELATTDPKQTIALRLSPASEGVIELDARVRGPGRPQALRIGFRGQGKERYLGFGERSNAVDQAGGEVENYVADGPYQGTEYPLISNFVPPWGLRARADSTYYPVPWLLSSAGYGVLIDSPQTSYFHLGKDGWSAEVANAPHGEAAPAGAQPPAQLSLRFFAGPEPADALRRFTRATGRQPPAPAPWVFGPWVQPTGDASGELEQLDQLRTADAPFSVAQTYLHYLPCGDQLNGREAERARTAAIHRRGLAVTTYLNPMICTTYPSAYAQAAGDGGLIEHRDGTPYTFSYSTSSAFDVAEFDFTSPAGRAGFAGVAKEAIADGHDGWMEDFGEYTPLDSRTHAGAPGTVVHNRYPRQYHCAAFDAIAGADHPVVRFQRSGWTGAARCAQVVWGGDPTTSWGFDGLRSSMRQALSAGLSGVSTWGSDIGGFFSLFGPRLDGELLTRWVQFGAVSGVMRTQAGGIAIPDQPRPQIWDSDQIDNWRRYSKLRTQLYPYIAAAARQYRHTGLPLMRQLSLAYPHDERANGRENEFLFGPDLLAAPVLKPGASRRSVYLPSGKWVHLWNALSYRPGSGGLRMDHRARLLRGHRFKTVAARLKQLPLLVRAGTILPMLPPDVETLADDYAGPRTKSLADASHKLMLYAFPRKNSEANLYEGERLRSRARSHRWTLKVLGEHERAYELSASLATLRHPLRPCSLSLDGRRVPDRTWRFNRRTKVLRTTLRGRTPRLVVHGRCGGR